MSDSWATEYDVFLSYSSADRVRVRRLARRLRASGLTVWFDEWSIKPGDDIYLSIEKGLESARTLVLCMSPSSFASEWSSLERSTALFRDPCNVKRRFVPVLLTDCTIPSAVSRLKYIDYRGEGRAALAELVLACEMAEPPASTAAGTTNRIVLKLEQTLTGHKGWVWDVAISPDGRWAVSGSTDTTVRVWDLESTECISTLQGHFGDVNCVAISPEGRRILSASDDQRVCVWDPHASKLVKVIPTSDSKVLSSVFPGGRRIVTAGPNSSVRVMNFGTGRQSRLFKGHRDDIWALSVAPDGKRILSGGFDSEIRYWSVRSGRCIRVLTGHAGVVNSVAFTPCGRFAVSGSDDRTVRVWDLSSGRCVKALLAHSRAVYSIGMAARGGLVASTGFLDETVRVWDWRTGECLCSAENPDHASPVAVAFSRDARRLVVGTATPDAVYVYSVVGSFAG